MPNQDFSEQSQDEALQPIAKKGKFVGGKIAKRGAAILGKALKQAIILLIKFIAANAVIFLGFLLLAFISYQIIFNMQGVNQQYSPEYNNAYEINEEGFPVTSEDNISAENKTIRDFYRYHSGISYYQIVGSDNTKLINPDSEDAVQDYYRSADIFKLNSNLLYSLDEYLFDRKFRYPEQFIKPVNYDPDTLTLKPLVDENKIVNVESKEIDLETGKPTGQTIKSVRDYGLASVVKYNNSQDWYKTVTFKGSFNYKDVWDSNAKKVVKKRINEPFNTTMSGYPQKIYLVEKVISFAGELTYNYEYRETKVSDLQPGAGLNSSSPSEKYKYGTHKETVYWYVKDENGNTAVDKYGMPIKKYRTDSYDLYKYRSADSGIYEKIPVESGTTSTEKGLDYFKDYVYNFESYVPSDVISDFNFDDRIDYESLGLLTQGTLTEDYMLPLGELKESKKFDNTLKHLPLVKLYAEEFGIDAAVLFAVVVQESGGDATINKNGLMQITSNAYVVSQTAKDKDGKTVTVSVTLPERQDPAKSIRYAAAYLKRLKDKFDGDILKAVQGYNLGEGTMGVIKSRYPAAWNSTYGWLKYREEARVEKATPNSRSASYDCMIFTLPKRTTGSYWGDSCYLEHVMKYYAGNDLEKVKTQGESWNLLASVGDLLSSLLPSKVKEIPHMEWAKAVHQEKVEIILRQTASFDRREFFSEVEDYENLNFWDEGFLGAMGTIGMSLQDLMGVSGAFGEYSPPIVLGKGVTISSKFGNRFHPIFKTYRLHSGVDVAAPTGTPLYAIAKGTVEIAKFGKGYGNYVKVKHEDGTLALYAHLNTLGVKTGDSVIAGQSVGTVGSTGDSTGPHLHFEFHVNGAPVDPINLIDRSVALKALSVALTKVGSPYVWGAAGPSAFDCSGLVLWAYQQVGYKNMPRTTGQQYLVGQPVSKANAQPGDLIYFKNGTSGAAVDHVGIYLGENMMLHAPNPEKPVEKRTVYWNKMVTIRRHQ